MVDASKSQCASHGWLDSLAISMSVVCAVHCLLTPILIITFPILATTLWVHEDFHLWMLLLVLPTTSLAVFLGCRKHRDKFVVGLSSIGLACLFAVSMYETFFHLNPSLQQGAHCVHCAQANLFNASNFINVMGGVFLASAHVRNYRLCRRLRCSHD